MNTTHTPGPWTLDGDRWQIIAANGSIMAKVATGENHREELANARLITASPCLLEALQDTAEQLATWFEMADPDDVNANDKAILANARAAIAKALS